MGRALIKLPLMVVLVIFLTALPTEARHKKHLHHRGGKHNPSPPCTGSKTHTPEPSPVPAPVATPTPEPPLAPRTYTPPPVAPNPPYQTHGCGYPCVDSNDCDWPCTSCCANNTCCDDQSIYFLLPPSPPPPAQLPPATPPINTVSAPALAPAPEPESIYTPPTAPEPIYTPPTVPEPIYTPPTVPEPIYTPPTVGAPYPPYQIHGCGHSCFDDNDCDWPCTFCCADKGCCYEVPFFMPPITGAAPSPAPFSSRPLVGAPAPEPSSD